MSRIILLKAVYLPERMGVDGAVQIPVCQNNIILASSFWGR